MILVSLLKFYAVLRLNFKCNQISKSFSPVWPEIFSLNTPEAWVLKKKIKKSDPNQLNLTFHWLIFSQWFFFKMRSSTEISSFVIINRSLINNFQGGVFLFLRSSMLRETHGLTHTDMLTNVTIRKQEGYSPCNKCAQHKWDQFFFKETTKQMY